MWIINFWKQQLIIKISQDFCILACFSQYISKCPERFLSELALFTDLITESIGVIFSNLSLKFSLEISLAKTAFIWAWFSFSYWQPRYSHLWGPLLGCTSCPFLQGWEMKPYADLIQGGFSCWDPMQLRIVYSRLLNSESPCSEVNSPLVNMLDILSSPGTWALVRLRLAPVTCSAGRALPRAQVWGDWPRDFFAASSSLRKSSAKLKTQPTHPSNELVGALVYFQFRILS